MLKLGLDWDDSWEVGRGAGCPMLRGPIYFFFIVWWKIFFFAGATAPPSLNVALPLSAYLGNIFRKEGKNFKLFNWLIMVLSTFEYRRIFKNVGNSLKLKCPICLGFWYYLRLIHIRFPLCAETFAFSFWGVQGCKSEECLGENFRFFFWVCVCVFETLLPPLL